MTNERCLDSPHSAKDAPRRTIEYSISVSSTVQSDAIAVNGPMYDPMILLPAPMIADPTILDPLIWAPASTRTRPMISVSESTVPSSRGSTDSSTDSSQFLNQVGYAPKSSDSTDQIIHHSFSLRPYRERPAAHLVIEPILQRDMSVLLGAAWGRDAAIRPVRSRWSALRGYRRESR